MKLLLLLILVLGVTNASELEPEYEPEMEAEGEGEGEGGVVLSVSFQGDEILYNWSGGNGEYEPEEPGEAEPLEPEEPGEFEPMEPGEAEGGAMISGTARLCTVAFSTPQLTAAEFMDGSKCLAKGEMSSATSNGQLTLCRCGMADGHYKTFLTSAGTGQVYASRGFVLVAGGGSQDALPVGPGEAGEFEPPESELEPPESELEPVEPETELEPPESELEPVEPELEPSELEPSELEPVEPEGAGEFEPPESELEPAEGEGEGLYTLGLTFSNSAVTYNWGVGAEYEAPEAEDGTLGNTLYFCTVNYGSAKPSAANVVSQTGCLASCSSPWSTKGTKTIDRGILNNEHYTTYIVRAGGNGAPAQHIMSRGFTLTAEGGTMDAVTPGGEGEFEPPESELEPPESELEPVEPEGELEPPESELEPPESELEPIEPEGAGELEPPESELEPPESELEPAEGGEGGTVLSINFQTPGQLLYSWGASGEAGEFEPGEAEPLEPGEAPEPEEGGAVGGTYYLCTVGYDLAAPTAAAVVQGTGCTSTASLSTTGAASISVCRCQMTAGSHYTTYLAKSSNPSGTGATLVTSRGFTLTATGGSMDAAPTGTGGEVEEAEEEEPFEAGGLRHPMPTSNKSFIDFTILNTALISGAGLFFLGVSIYAWKRFTYVPEDSDYYAIDLDENVVV